MEHQGSRAISKKSPGVAALPIVRNHMQNKEQEDISSCYIFFFSPPHRFYVSGYFIF